MTDKKYILDKNHNLVETDLITWAKFFRSFERIVKQENLSSGVEISTVFLGLDHNWGEGDPLLFETMIFGGDRNGKRWLWHTWEEAEKEHKKIVDELKFLNKDELKFLNKYDL